MSGSARASAPAPQGGKENVALNMMNDEQLAQAFTVALSANDSSTLRNIFLV